MDNQQPTTPAPETQAPVQAEKPVETMLPEEDRKAPAIPAKLGTCTRPECACIHEHGLVPVKNADGSYSQVSEEQAKAQLESLKALESQLGGQK